jgi:hypothetical protein
MQHQQIRIARNDVIGIAINSQLKELVIVGVTTDRNWFSRIYQLGFLQQTDEEPHSLIFEQIFVKFFATENVGEF